MELNWLRMTHWCESSHVHGVCWVLPQPLSELFAGNCCCVLFLEAARCQRSGTGALLGNAEGHVGTDSTLNNLHAWNLHLLSIILDAKNEQKLNEA